MIVQNNSAFDKIQFVLLLLMIASTACLHAAAPEPHPLPSASAIGIYMQGCEPVEEFMDVLGMTHVKVPSDFSPHHVRRETSVIVLPVMSASALWQSESFCLSLDLFIQKLGGTLICLVQKTGDHLRVIPVPRSEPEIAGPGFREMHSAYFHATENIADHPILAGLNSVNSDLNFDGYFTCFPANSEVLIIDRNKGYPVLLTYPCGNGRVIITTLTLGIGTGFASSDEFRLASNILSYSLDGDSMPEFIMNPLEPDHEISKDVYIVNTSNRFGSYMETTFLAPDRTVLHSYKQDFERDMFQPGELNHLKLTASVEPEPGIYWFDVRVFECPGHEIESLHQDFRIHVTTRAAQERIRVPSVVAPVHRDRPCTVPCTGDIDSGLYSSIEVTNCPESLTVTPGENIELPFELTNNSDETQTFNFGISCGDLFSWSRQVVLEPGQSDVILFEGRMPDDLSPHGITVIRYSVDGCRYGTMRINVAKYPLDLNVGLDAGGYHPGDTAYIRFEFTDRAITREKPSQLQLYVFHGKWQEHRSVVLEGEQTEIEVPFPIDLAVDTIHYIVCMESGRVLAKGVLPVQRLYPACEVQLDRTHYKPGDIMTLSIRADKPGICNIVMPWSSLDFHADTHVKNFETQIPEFVFEGKHHLSYFVGDAWRSVPFFVTNTSLTVISSSMCLSDDSVFISGDTLTIALDIISTKDETVEAVSRLRLPSGESGKEIAGKSFHLKENIINHLVLSGPIISGEAGPHDIITDFSIDSRVISFRSFLDRYPV